MGGIIIGSKKEVTKWEREEGKEKIKGIVKDQIRQGKFKDSSICERRHGEEIEGVERVDGRKGGRNVDNHRRF